MPIWVHKIIASILMTVFAVVITTMVWGIVDLVASYFGAGTTLVLLFVVIFISFYAAISIE
jgi:hypothetical protein